MSLTLNLSRGDLVFYQMPNEPATVAAGILSPVPAISRFLRVSTGDLLPGEREVFNETDRIIAQWEGESCFLSIVFAALSSISTTTRDQFNYERFKILFSRLTHKADGAELPQELRISIESEADYQLRSTLLSSRIAVEILQSIYKLEPTSWRVSEGIIGLERELRSHGPMLAFGGDFGPKNYKTTPQKADEIGNQTIWGFALGSERNPPGPVTGRTFGIIVGTNLPKNIVYYRIVSDVRIFASKFETFCSFLDNRPAEALFNGAYNPKFKASSAYDD